jgi:hypothetical protein
MARVITGGMKVQKNERMDLRVFIFSFPFFFWDLLPMNINELIFLPPSPPSQEERAREGFKTRFLRQI